MITIIQVMTIQSQVREMQIYLAAALIFQLMVQVSFVETAAIG